MEARHRRVRALMPSSASALSRRTSPPNTPSRETPPELPVGGAGGCPSHAPPAGRPAARRTVRADPTAQPHRPADVAGCLLERLRCRRWGCACSQQPRRASGGSRRSLARVPETSLRGQQARRGDRPAATADRLCAHAFAAARIVGRASRSGGGARGARVAFAAVSARRRPSRRRPQQLPEPTSAASAAEARAAASVLEEVSALDTETETSTLAVDTEMSTVPSWTISVTPGTLTLTSTATVGTVGITGGGGASSARAVATCSREHQDTDGRQRAEAAFRSRSRRAPNRRRAGTADPLPAAATTSRHGHGHPPPLLVSNVAETRREVNAIRKNLPAEPENPAARARSRMVAEQRTGLPALPCGGLGR